MGTKGRLTNKFAILVAAGLLFTVFSASSINGQTNSYGTNVLINLSFNLTAYEQSFSFQSPDGFNGPYLPIVKTVTVGTSSVIKAIHDFAHLTDNLDGAKLCWRITWSGPSQFSQDVILRNPNGAIMGTNDMVVTNYLNLSFPDSVTASTPTVSGATNSTDYASCIVSLGTIQESFGLHGLATIKSGSLFYGKTVIDPNPVPKSFTITLLGSGAFGFHRAEWKGTITGSGQKVEIVQTSQ
jgi:hypothetical protein